GAGPVGGRERCTPGDARAAYCRKWGRSGRNTMQSHQRAGLKGLPQEARPREKLLARGASALSDAELLALLLRTGHAGTHVLQFAQELLDSSGGVAGLLSRDHGSLGAIKGLGPAKRAVIAAVMEIARRALAQPLRQ